MKASDFVSTSTERDDAALRLIQTEETDAVNSGIVGSADKSGSALKGASVIHKAAKGGVSNAALAAVTSGRKAKSGGAAVDADGSESLADGVSATKGGRSLKSYIKGGTKAAASGVAARAVGKTLEGTELEGADDLYYKGKAARRVVRYARRRFGRTSDAVGSTKSAGKRALSLSGRNAESASPEKPLGALSEKGAGRKAKSAAELKRKAQMSGYFKRNVYSAAAQQTAAKTTVSKSVTTVVQGGVKGFLSAAASAAAPFLLGVLALVLVIGIISAICGGAAEDERQKSASLEGMPQWVTYELVLSCLEAHEQYGYPASALLGQMMIENGTSDTGSTLGREYHNYGGIKCSQSMLSSYPDLIVDRVQLLTTEYNGNGTAYKTYAYFAVFASDKAYMTYRCEHLYKQPNYTSVPDFQRAIDNNDSELFLRALGEGGYYTASQDSYISQYRSICEAYPLVAQLDSMTSEDFKNSVGGSLTGGQDYASASDVQRRIVDACYRVPSPGAGWCAAWVTNVYRAAGLPAPSGNACCMYLNYCTSSNPDDLKVGMIVAYQQSKTSHGISNYGHLGYGHVGIYIGDGMVMSNLGSIVTETLEQFASSRYSGCDVKWGYPPGVS